MLPAASSRPSEVTDLRRAAGGRAAARVLRLLDVEGGLHQGARLRPGAAARRFRVQAQSAGAAGRSHSSRRSTTIRATWQFLQDWPTPQHRLGLAVRRTATICRSASAQVVPQVVSAGEAVGDQRSARRLRRESPRRPGAAVVSRRLADHRRRHRRNAGAPRFRAAHAAAAIRAADLDAGQSRSVDAADSLPASNAASRTTSGWSRSAASTAC